MEHEPREINPGKEWAERLKPGGCILVLVVTVLCMLLRFTSGPDPIEGYAPPESEAYYAQHLEELQTELETHVFPELEGVLRCEQDGEVLVITLERDHFINTRAAILQYYGQSLFRFEQTIK